MLTVCPLFSGSSGNSTFVGAGAGGILIDAGKNCKAIVTSLEKIGVEPSGLHAVFLTHSHSDHVSALRVFNKKYKLPIYATLGTIEGVREQMDCSGMNFIEVPDKVDVSGMLVRHFNTPHDAYGSCGYRIDTADRSAAVVTDLGKVTDEVMSGIAGCNTVLIEANYDDAMLSVSPYPMYLKRRIASPSGHLSNNQCAETVVRLAKSGTTRFYLGHLSRENNNPCVAYETVKSMLTENDLAENRDYILRVAKRDEPSEPYVF